MNDPRATRVARNEAYFRAVNERIVDSVSQFKGDLAELVRVLCECADAACADMLDIATHEYGSVREHSTRFVVRPGHVVLDVEQVVRQLPSYWVVEKTGEAGEEAARLDEGHEPS